MLADPIMTKSKYDIIVIGAGSGGLGISLFMAKSGLKTLLIDKTDEHIGGDCLNYGCVPSKALIHVSRIVHKAKEAERFGIAISGKPDIAKATEYVLSRQSIIRKHENAEYLRLQGLEVVLGNACFDSMDSVKVADTIYAGKRIVIATGSRPASLTVPGIERVERYNNESIFDVRNLPPRMLIVGGGPIGIEIGQALHRLGTKVTIVHRSQYILQHDEREISSILFERLAKEGVEFILSTEVEEFPSAKLAILVNKEGKRSTVEFDALFVATGRMLDLESLRLELAGIKVENNRIVVNDYLQTSNKAVYTCGDISGSLKFSHAAEQHARLLLNNFFSPLKKKLNNDHMSWVTFTDPEVATFGLQEQELKTRSKDFEKLLMDFSDDDRAVVDDYRYGKLVLYLSKEGFFKGQRILGGSMVAPHAGELIQELILANVASLNVNEIFNKIYPYPVASRVNQMIIVKKKEKLFTERLTRLLRFVYRLLN